MTHVHLPLTPSWLLWPQPWAWTLLLIALLPVLLTLWRHASRRAAIRFSSLAAAGGAGGRWRRWVRGLLPMLRSAALLCLIVAAARPQSADETRRVVIEGVAIHMVLDTSWSMTDLDLSPTDRRQSRLDIVKEVFRRFVKGNDSLPGRPSDLIGIIRFARHADSICPLTLDHEALLAALDPLDVAVNELGRPLEESRQTAIGDGLALAVEHLKDLQRTTGSGDQYTITSRVIVLLTDGENNAGRITPAQAGALAAHFGIRVYTILAGTGQRVGDRRLPVDDRVLRRIADISGGRHFQARDRAALDAIYAEINELERSRAEERRYVQWRELSWGWLLIAFACLSLQTLLDATWLRKIP